MKRPIRLPVFTTLLAVWLFLPGPLSARGAGDERLIREIEDTLIAPCCWNQPISQHYSEVSEQMRREVRAMVAAGRTKRDILDHFVARYGERILARYITEDDLKEFNQANRKAKHAMLVFPWIADGGSPADQQVYNVLPGPVRLFMKPIMKRKYRAYFG